MENKNYFTNYNKGRYRNRKQEIKIERNLWTEIEFVSTAVLSVRTSLTDPVHVERLKDF